MAEFTVTPWEAKGRIDYDKLIEQFGTKPFNEELKKELQSLCGELHLFFRRNIVFSHRDFDLVLRDLKNGNKFFLYTGRAPGGPMHIGHILPFYLTKWLQDKFKVNVYIMIADEERFLQRDDLSYEDTAKKWSYENILDIIAVGFDEERTFIFQDTEFIAKLYPKAVQIAKKINFSLVKAVFGFENDTNIGLIFYPAIQMVPTFFEKKRCLIPAGIDQDPYWRIQRDIAESMNYYKTSALHLKLLPALTGIWEKMSTSKPETSIFLSDQPKIVKEKIFKHAFSGGQATVELHRKYGGDTSVDVSFQWLYFFFEEDDAKIKKIEEDYRSGKLLSGELKQILIDKVIKFLEEFRERRERAKEMVHVFKYEGKLAKEMWNLA